MLLDQQGLFSRISLVWFLLHRNVKLILPTMPRKLRIQYPGAMYHVMSRGDRREKIFLDDIDRQDFIKTLAEACQKTGWQVHAYCPMPNHYHVALETPEPNLVARISPRLSIGRFGFAWTGSWGARNPGRFGARAAAIRAADGNSAL